MKQYEERVATGDLIIFVIVVLIVAANVYIAW